MNLHLIVFIAKIKKKFAIFVKILKITYTQDKVKRLKQLFCVCVCVCVCRGEDSSEKLGAQKKGNRAELRT